MLLLIGGDSEIGKALSAFLESAGVPHLATTRRRPVLDAGKIFFDLDDPDGWSLPSGISSTCICAAVARLADCERDFEGARRINVLRTLQLTHYLTARGIFSLFLSTNQVFDGTLAKVRAEAPLSPISSYGRQKAEAEATLHAAISRGEPVGILRLAKVVAPDMALVLNWARNLRAGQHVRAFSDMVMAPTPITEVCRAIAAMMTDQRPVIAQLSGPSDISYLRVARLVADLVKADQSLVQSVLAAENGLPANCLPANTTLDSRYLQQTHGIAIDAPEAVIEHIVGGTTVD